VQAALDLAVQLGGAVATVAAPDVTKAVLGYAAEHNVTHIVAGRGPRMGRFLQKQAVAFTLHFVPIPAAAASAPLAAPAVLAWAGYVAAGAALCVATLIGSLAAPYLPQAAMGLIFTAIIAGAASRFGRNVGLATAVLAFLMWDFFFLPPLYTFTVADPRDLVTLAIFLASGLITGQLAGRVRVEAEAATARIEALRRISLLGQRFAPATTQTDILDITATEGAAMTSAAVVLLPGPGGLTAAAAVPAATVLDNAAMAAASWAQEHKTETGIGTATLPSIAWRFIPLALNGQVLGVLGALPKTPPLPPLVQSLKALADQAAMALARVQLTITTVKTEAREDNQKLRTALLSSLSHDLRTPLTGIRGAAEVLQQSPGIDADIRADLLASIVQDTERMTKFLTNIMEMARVETGEISARRERLKVTDVIEAAISRIPAAMYAGINIAAPASHVLADPTLLEQVLVNILDNAAKYAPEGSRISIAGSRAGANVVLKIADEGVGIPAADLPHVFDSFFRATRGDRVAPGTGLGLAIAKAFTEAMGGSIAATSPRLDLPADGLPGTVITVTLVAA
jgi:two-component system sensor histidine kinase KdpD